MKKFSAFLKEAQKSFAAQEAEKLNLKHVGYGKYADQSGKVTHMSQDGKLRKLTAKELAGGTTNGGEETAGGEGTVDQGSISVTFGRFNPPTTGHEALLNKVKSASGGGEYRIYPSRSQDPQKNPLDPGTKIKFMKKAYPDHANAIQNSEETKTIFDVLTTLDGEGYSSVNIVVGGDRVSEFNSLATKYNGKLYNFDDIKVSSAGDRDPDGEGVEGMSASKLRKAAMDDDYDTFVSGMPEKLGRKGKEELYNTLRQAMNVQEDLDDFQDASYTLYEIAPKLDPQALREHYFEGHIFKIGDLVENVNTGICGKVVSRGSNYVIFVDESERIYRSWLKDLQEINKLKYFNFTPAGEIGTDELANYAKKLTPGEFVKKINKKEKVLK